MYDSRGVHATEPDYDVSEPRAGSMIQSLRAFGYDLSSAIADLVDNSITAGAHNVWLDFYWNGGDSCIAITDDGRGMTEARLSDAMRLGSQSPLEARGPDDLGRFGLGLKTASFSQARRLTVCSRQAATREAIRCWDLDYVTSSGQWRLLKGGSASFTERGYRRLAALTSGAVVFWETLDRLIPPDTRAEDDRAQTFFSRCIDQTREHLSMVFHRFLKPDTPGTRGLKIWVNDRAVPAWDPFLMEERATQHLPEESVRIAGDAFSVRPYVLPHHSKVRLDVYERAAGPRGWNAQQGFYVYRNRRLLVAGGWLGLGHFRREEHHKLARILVDIPNHMDALWDIDVKKSRATPPLLIREQLTQIARATRARASSIYRHRGKRLTSEGERNMVLLWDTTAHHNQFFYRINRSHPVVQEALHSGKPVAVRALLHLVEETLPVPTIVQHGMENPTAQSAPFDEGARQELRSILSDLFRSQVANGKSAEDARQYLLLIEPFNQFPELVAAVGEEP